MLNVCGLPKNLFILFAMSMSKSNFTPDFLRLLSYSLKLNYFLFKEITNMILGIFFHFSRQDKTLGSGWVLCYAMVDWHLTAGVASRHAVISVEHYWLQTAYPRNSYTRHFLLFVNKPSWCWFCTICPFIKFAIWEDMLLSLLSAYKAWLASFHSENRKLT